MTPALRAQYGAPVVISQVASSLVSLTILIILAESLGWPCAFRPAVPADPAQYFPGLPFLLMFWHVFFPAFGAFLASLWLPFVPFGSFWMDLGFHFGSILASFCYHFCIIVSSLILLTFFFIFLCFLGTSSRPNRSNSERKTMAFKETAYHTQSKESMTLVSILIFWVQPLGIFSFSVRRFCIDV